ncbi:hypothetical protein BD310DRAFT_958607 [Dichomitus squalens]|uniref:Uncharacterized protein n=1 Tax=Dichomitus squalens TaxID=114155 RepID=A0A4V2K867_9APHY|nr:hypothetical protein BD310DRAFT_958607 [Dichomitus squalens]
MEAEIEEAQRQIRRSAAIIQDTLQDLTTLQRMHNRAPEASLAARAPTDTSSLVTTPSANSVRSTEGAQEATRSTVIRSSPMDPGHDVIVISSETSTPAPSISFSTPAPPTPSSSTPSPASRGPRPLDSTLAVLGADLRSMTQSFRERVSEFDELRRAIAQYAQERHSRATERARSRSPPPDMTSLPPSLRLYEPEGSPPSSTNGTDAVPATGAPRRFNGRIRTLRGDSQSTLDRRSSLLRQRTTSDSETSLGLLVAARTASSNARNSVAETPTITPATISASARSVAVPSRPVATPAPSTSPSAANDRSEARHIPSNITSRITRLAQEIQQEGVRITQQAESLRSWINDRNARLDALRLPSPSSTIATRTILGLEPERPMTQRVPSPMIIGTPYLADLSTPTSENDPPSLLPWSQPAQRPRPSEPDPRPRDPPRDGALSLPRRAPETAVRARYLRQNVPTSWSATSPSSASPREDRVMAWNPPSREARERATDGPLSPPSRTIAPSGTQGGARGDGTATTRPTAFAVEFDEEVIARRNDIVRVRNERLRAQAEVDSEDDGELTESRSYRVRRRYNADGDEEVFRVELRPETFPGFGETSANRRAPPNEWEDDSGEEDSWMDALSRLDSMSRRSAAARDTRDRWEMPRMVRTGAQMGTVVPPTTLGPPTYPVNMARRSTRGWPRLYADEDISADSETQYERDLSAMRARAQALISAHAPARALGGTTLPPPPPPATRPPSFVPTTQAPGSLWNDSSVRVRLRTTAAHSNSEAAFVRGALDAARPAGRDRNGNGGGARAARDLASATSNSRAERPTWGSPVPFFPSALPLPLVEEVGSLQVRSRVFSSAKKDLARMPRRRLAAQVGR